MEKIIYNVTCKVEHSFLEEWLKWMKEVHLPDVMATNKFESYRLTQMLGDDNAHGVTFAVQYLAPSLTSYMAYQNEDAPRLQQDGKEFCGEKCLTFRTLLKIIDHS